MPLLPLMAILTLPLLVVGCGPTVEEQELERFPPLAPLPTPADGGYRFESASRTELGRMLFFDRRLSSDNRRACADCHQPERGFSGSGDATWRDVPGLVNVGYRQTFNWDGSARSLESQAAQHAADALVLGARASVMEARLALVPAYRRLFRRAYGLDEPRADAVWKALAAFQLSLVQIRTPFDRYSRGDEWALNEAQTEGLKLFNGKAGCIRCHNGPMASDGRYHNLGVPTVELWKVSGEEQIAFRYRQRLRGVSRQQAERARVDRGRGYVEQQEAASGAFLTPTLRQLRYTAPYMHNGSMDSLEQVVAFYNQGGEDPEGRVSAHRSGRSRSIRPLDLDGEEQAALVAFLKALSGEPRVVERPTLPAYRAEPPQGLAPQGTRSIRERLAPRLYLLEPSINPLEGPR